jgi:hypothetical protein
MIDETDGDNVIKMEIVIDKEGVISTKDPNALVLYSVWNNMMNKAKQEARDELRNELLDFIKTRGES